LHGSKNASYLPQGSFTFPIFSHFCLSAYDIAHQCGFATTFGKNSANTANFPESGYLAITGNGVTHAIIGPDH